MFFEGKEYDLLKPYEKFLKMGAEALTDTELLAIILRTGTKNKDALALAEEILSKGEDRLLSLYDITMDKLLEISGIGEVKAVKILCIAELSKRISMQKHKKGVNFHSPSAIAAYFMEQLRHKKVECLVLLCLDGKGTMLSHSIMSSGSVRMSPVSPREIFMEALQKKAVNIILIHNHPSGDASPSNTDREVTKKIYQLGETLGIPLLDHIIIGDNEYYSFMEQNRLTGP